MERSESCRKLADFSAPNVGERIRQTAHWREEIGEPDGWLFA